MESIKALTEEEILQLQSSINHAVKDLELLVKRFYYYFLQTDAGIMFKDTNIDKQYKMFTISLRIILDHIHNPTHIMEQLDDLITSHKKYGVKPEHTDYLVESFLKALREVFKGYPLDESQVNTWKIFISDVMLYFKQGLVN